MNEFNTYEFVVSQKKEGKVNLYRILAVVGYVLFFLAVFATLCVLHIPQFVAVLPIFEWILIFFTWRYLSQEYEYSMTSGYMTFTVIYGGRSKKKKLEVCIKDMKEIAPYDEAACARLENRGLTFSCPPWMRRICTMRCSIRRGRIRWCTLRPPRKPSRSCGSTTQSRW